MPAKRNMPSHAKVFQYWQENGAIFATKHICMHCGYEAKGHNLDRAHIIAKCDGGPDTVDNLVLVCRPCHIITDGWSKEIWEIKAKGFDVFYYPWLTGVDVPIIAMGGSLYDPYKNEEAHA